MLGASRVFREVAVKEGKQRIGQHWFDNLRIGLHDDALTGDDAKRSWTS